MDVSALRRSPAGSTLEREDLRADAIKQFEDWFRQACDSDMLDPNAMSVATVDNTNKPALCTVLLKYFDHKGFVFFTNLASNKAQHIAKNSNVALLFLWSGFDRQVSIKGTAEKISAKDTMRYFVTRPRGSQIGAWVSAQSSVISSRALLEAKFEEMKQKYMNKDGRIVYMIVSYTR
jgi:pyridoxamine 5'-phosphate oxidase